MWLHAFASSTLTLCADPTKARWRSSLQCPCVIHWRNAGCMAERKAVKVSPLHLECHWVIACVSFCLFRFTSCMGQVFCRRPGDISVSLCCSARHIISWHEVVTFFCFSLGCAATTLFNDCGVLCTCFQPFGTCSCCQEVCPVLCGILCGYLCPGKTLIQ